MKTPSHTPVMLEEVLRYLDPRPGDTIVDATLGLGGHSESILRKLAGKGLLLGIDRDPKALELAARRLRGEDGEDSTLSSPLRLCAGPFNELNRFLREADLEIASIDAILLDLGVSSMQLDEADRGFSFQSDGPLDMRMDPLNGLSAAEYLKRASVKEIETILRRYGEERAARKIAMAIDRYRSSNKIATTRQLAEIVESVIPRGAQKKHPATRTFQAVRIAVNAELEMLEDVLRDLDRLLAPGGRVVVLSYHSLEDRIVKQALGGHVKAGLMEWVVDGIEQPSEAEVSVNPRSRSARLRCARRIGQRKFA